MLGPTPMAGPPPSAKVLSAGPSGVLPWVTSTATQKSGATAQVPTTAPAPDTSSRVEPRIWSSTSSSLSRSSSAARRRVTKQARSSMDLPHICSSPRGKQPARYTMGVPTGTALSASSWDKPTSTYSSFRGTLLSSSPPAGQATSPRRGGSVSTTSSRPGSIRGSTPPMLRKRRKPSSTPVTIRPISSRWASSSSLGASGVLLRRTPSTLPMRSMDTSSTRGRSSSAATAAAGASNPEGAVQVHSRSRACLISKFHHPFRPEKAGAGKSRPRSLTPDRR